MTQQTQSNNTFISFLIGFLIASVIGGLAWLIFAELNSNSAQGPDVINVPAPEAPEAPKAPDVNINVPSPDVNLPDVELPNPANESAGQADGGGNSETSGGSQQE